MKRILSLLLIVALQLGLMSPASAVESTGTPVNQTFTTTTANILNPERGWYEWGTAGGYLISWNGSTYGGVTSSAVTSTRANGYSLNLGLIDLSQFRVTSTIPAGFITELGNRFAVFRAGGQKVIPRIVYNYDQAGCDASTTISVGHIAQLKQVLRDNADVIAFAQGGTFGPYGEQWQGTCSVTRSAADFVALRDALLAAYHPRTTVAFRYPARINALYPSAMTEAQFTTGSAQSRSAFFHDCWMSDPGDGGTYTSLTDTKRVRVASDTNWLPIGGETCTLSQGPKRTACSNVLQEGPYYHWTYLNRGYDASFYNAWISGGCYDQVTRSMGYRLQLDSMSHQSTALVNQTVTMNVQMRNVGWARVWSARRLQVRLMSGSTISASAMSYLDLRQLPPQATASQRVPVKVTVPAAAGTYNVVLCIPDVWFTTAADPRNNIRFANADSPGAWNGSTGCFATSTSVIVS